MFTQGPFAVREGPRLSSVEDRFESGMDRQIRPNGQSAEAPTVPTPPGTGFTSPHVGQGDGVAGDVRRTRPRRQACTVALFARRGRRAFTTYLVLTKRQLRRRKGHHLSCSKNQVRKSNEHHIDTLKVFLHPEVVDGQNRAALQVRISVTARRDGNAHAYSKDLAGMMTWRGSFLLTRVH